MQGVQQSLIEDQRPVTSIRDKLADRIAKNVLKLRFSEHVYQAQDIVQEVARPVAIFAVLVLAMLLSTVAALGHLGCMNKGLAPHCTAFVSQVTTPATAAAWGEILTIKTKSEWSKDRLQSIMDLLENEEVQYEHFFIAAADGQGNTIQIDNSSPWDADISHLTFPFFLNVTQENVINVANVIRDNIGVQVLNPLWLILSCSGIWGYVFVPSAGPIGHLVQLAFAGLVVSSAAGALISPPGIYPPMSAQQLQNFNKCQGNDQGLAALTWILLFQTSISFLLLPAAGAVGRSFSHLNRFSATLKAITMQPSTDLSDSVCPICLESLSSGFRNQEDTSKVWTLPCAHTFHKDCVFPWLWRSTVSVGTCPTCRGNLPNIE